MRKSPVKPIAFVLLCLCLSGLAWAHDDHEAAAGMDLAITLIVRWMHIIPAIVMAGGSFFMWAILNPSMREALDSETQLKMRQQIVKRWKIVLHTCIALFLLSGFYNYLAITRHLHEDQPIYHMLFGIKFLLAMAVFFLAICMTSTKNWSLSIRKNAPFWARVIVMLALWIVLMAGYMKVLGS